LFAGGYSTSTDIPYVFAYIKLYSHSDGIATFETFSDAACTTLVDIFNGTSGTIDHVYIDNAASVYNGTDIKITLLGRHSFTYPCTYSASDITGRIFVFPKFYVHGNGTMHAENAEISGSILGNLSLAGSINKMVLADGLFTSGTTNWQGLFWTANSTDISVWKADATQMLADSDACIYYQKDSSYDRLRLQCKNKIYMKSDSADDDAFVFDGDFTCYYKITTDTINSLFGDAGNGLKIKINNAGGCVIKSDGIYDATGTTRKLAF